MVMKSLIETCPLKNVDIKGKLLGSFGVFDITQTFENTTQNTVEIFYTFPISSGAVVCDFKARIGEREIVGKVFSKQEAKERYQEALTHGNSAYLMENQGGNVFKIAVGKIAPNEIVEIKIGYIDTFEIIQNKIELRIPTVIAPRYNDKVTSTQNYKVETAYKAKIEIEIDKSISVKDIDCSTHTCIIKENLVMAKNVKLNKDFVLKLEMDNKGEQKSNGLYFERNNETFAFLQFMPHIEKIAERKPKDYVFIADCSGSMEGQKIHKCKNAIIKSLEHLCDNDTIQIITFGNSFNDFLSKTQATSEAIEPIVNVIEKSINADMGGTELLKPIKFAVDKNDNRTIILFTDGEISNNDKKEICTYLWQNIRNNNLFVFGIDDAVNMAVLSEIAFNGNGKAEYFSMSDDLDDKIVRQFNRINEPMSKNIKIDFGENKIDGCSQYSKTLFNNEYWQAVLKLEKLNGGFGIKFDGGECRIENLEKTELPLDKVFAMQRIKQIQGIINDNKYDDSIEGYKNQIIKLATDYNIQSEYTSFLIVNERGEKLFENSVQAQIELEQPIDSYDCHMSMCSPIMQCCSITRMKRLKDWEDEGGIAETVKKPSITQDEIENNIWKYKGHIVKLKVIENAAGKYFVEIYEINNSAMPIVAKTEFSKIERDLVKIGRF